MRYVITFLLITNLYAIPEFDDIDPENFPYGNFCVSLDKKSKKYINFVYYKDIKDFMISYDIHKLYIKECGGKNWKVIKRNVSKCDIHKYSETYKNPILKNIKF